MARFTALSLLAFCLTTTAATQQPQRLRGVSVGDLMRTGTGACRRGVYGTGPVRLD